MQRRRAPKKPRTWPNECGQQDTTISTSLPVAQEVNGGPLTTLGYEPCYSGRLARQDQSVEVFDSSMNLRSTRDVFAYP